MDLIAYRLAGPGKDLWDDNTGDPCVDDNLLDAYDWNNNGDYTDDHDAGAGKTVEQNSQVSTRIGCGLYLGTEVLKAGGRPDSVWVMVFLSDGITNLSDTNATNPDIPASYRYGFCGDQPATSFWSTYCIYWEPDPRYCNDEPANECPPDTDHTNQSGPFSVFDYALDMVDAAALLVSENDDARRPGRTGPPWRPYGRERAH